MNRTSMILTALLVLAATVAASDSTDFRVGEVRLSSTAWGEQTASFDLTNLSPDYRFITMLTQVRFPDVPQEAARVNRRSLLVAPGATVPLKISYEIPGQYGQGLLNIRLYDVVDTLDMLLESQLFYDREFEFNIAVPPRIQPIIDGGVHTPVFVDRTYAFDSDFLKIVLVLLHRGKSTAQIARLADVDEDYMVSTMNYLLGRGLVDSTASGFRPTVAIIDEAVREMIMSGVDETVAELYGLLEENLAAYEGALEGLIEAGEVTSDPNNLLEGTSILHHRYPVVLGLLLWDELGRDFVNDGQPFEAMRGADPCQGDMGEYLYLVTGDESGVGNTFYFYRNDRQGDRFYIGTGRPEISCGEDFTGRRQRGKSANWIFARGNPPIYYTIDPPRLKTALAVLAGGTREPLSALRESLDRVIGERQSDEVLGGARYWCWNMVVSELIDRLEKSGAIEKEGSGIYLIHKVGL